MTETTTLTAQKLLDQILGTGQELVKKAKAADTAELTAKGKDMFKQAEDALADKLGVGDDAESRKKLRLGAAATAGALALVLGNRSKRKFAALGGLGAIIKHRPIAQTFCWRPWSQPQKLMAMSAMKSTSC